MKNNFAGINPPDPTKETIWTNPNSGITYTWNDSIKAWDAVLAAQNVQNTATLPLANPTRIGNAKGLPDTSNLKTQSDYNAWTHNALESLASGVSPEVDLSAYATEEYVDQADNALSGRIQAVEQDYITSDEFSTVAQQVNKNKTDIKALQEAPAPEVPNLDSYATKQDLATATAALPYTIETDKALRLADIEIKNRFTGEAAPMYAGGEIYLTDNLSFFSNVRFTGLNNITTSSDAQGIIVDGAALMPKNLLSLPELT